MLHLRRLFVNQMLLLNHQLVTFLVQLILISETKLPFFDFRSDLFRWLLDQLFWSDVLAKYFIWDTIVATSLATFFDEGILLGNTVVGTDDEWTENRSISEAWRFVRYFVVCRLYDRIETIGDATIRSMLKFFESVHLCGRLLGPIIVLFQ